MKLKNENEDLCTGIGEAYKILKTTAEEGTTSKSKYVIIERQCSKPR